MVVLTLTKTEKPISNIFTACQRLDAFINNPLSSGSYYVC